MKKLLFTAPALYAMLMCSCIAVKDKDIVGTYNAAFIRKGPDTLIVKGNHTYVYHDHTMTHTGKWELKGSSLYFNNFKFSTDANTSTWITNVTVQDNDVRIMYADEEGCYYKKVNQPNSTKPL